ncbi:hypothetical protein H1R20_g7351, partial [Candolleomyces eurysporus]
MTPLSLPSDDTATTSVTADHGQDGRDLDDFAFWSEQKKAAIRQVFDVDYAPEVIVAYMKLDELTTAKGPRVERISG